MNKTQTASAREQPMKPLTVRFPAEDLEVVRRLARQNHRSLNAEIVHAVAEYIQRKTSQPHQEEDA